MMQIQVSPGEEICDEMHSLVTKRPFRGTTVEPVKARPASSSEQCSPKPDSYAPNRKQISAWLRLQISDFRFQISDFRFAIICDLRFEIYDLRFEI
jgi:hypothetical protein